MENIAVLSSSTSWMVSVLLLSIRLAVILLMTPVLQSFSAPPSVRILIVLALSASLAAGVPGAAYMQEINLPALLEAAVAELVVGFVLALGILLAFSAFSAAGRLVDAQVGFGMAQIYDPITRRQQPILTTVFDMVALVVFFTLNGHHALLRAVAFSLEKFPIGQSGNGYLFSQSMLNVVIKQSAAIFSLGFALVAPVVFCILLIEFGLSVLARNLQQMNIFVMSMLLKIAAGLVILAVWSNGMLGVMSKIYTSIFQYWNVVLH